MDNPKDRTKLKIRIESRTSSVPSSVSNGQAASYLDMKNSRESWAHSVLSLAESKNNDIGICHCALAIVKKSFHSSDFSGMAEEETDNDFFHARSSNLFGKVNGELVNLRNQGVNSEMSLCFALQRRNNLYIALAGNLDVLVIRDSVIYSLLAKDKPFEPVAVNPYKKNTSGIALGSTIIPVVNTYKLQIEPDDIILMVSEGVFREVSLKQIASCLKKPGGFEKNFSDLAEKASAKNPDKNISIIAMTAESMTESHKTKPLIAHQLLKSIVLNKGKTVAKLPPEMPPPYEELEIKRDKRDFYHTSTGILKTRIIDDVPEPLKIAIGSLAVILTITIGVFLFSEYFCFTEPVYNSNWSFSSKIPVTALTWNNIPVRGDDFSDYRFNHHSDKRGEMDIVTKNNQPLYNGRLTVYTGRPVAVQSDQSIGTISENHIVLSKEKIMIHTNLCTTVDRIVLSEKTVDPEGEDYYKISLNLNKIKGPIRLTTAPMRSLREINLSLFPAAGEQNKKNPEDDVPK